MDKFNGPYINKNIKGHILKYVSNTSFEKALETASARADCTCFVITDSGQTFYKSVEHDAAMVYVNGDEKVIGHTSYIKKKV